MTRLAKLFPVVYEQSSDGLVLAEHEFDRLTAVHAAYASQPNITAIWQGYIDKKARDVADQRLVVDRMRAVVRDELQAKADAATASAADGPTLSAQPQV